MFPTSVRNWLDWLALESKEHGPWEVSAGTTWHYLYPGQLDARELMKTPFLSIAYFWLTLNQYPGIARKSAPVLQDSSDILWECGELQAPPPAK
jgi:hypothetical protein